MVLMIESFECVLFSDEMYLIGTLVTTIRTIAASRACVGEYYTSVSVLANEDQVDKSNVFFIRFLDIDGISETRDTWG